MDSLILKQQIKAKAGELGFDLVGVSNALVRPEDHAFFMQWLSKGFNANMQWLQKNPHKRNNPDFVLEGAKSIISVGLNYYRGHPKSVDVREPGHGWISNYAWGEDYHEILIERLHQLENFVKKLEPQAKTRIYTDTGPLPERSMGETAGLGWIGKSTMLINQKLGSYFFLGEMITDLSLEPDTPDNDHCGTCTRCLDACPTQALTPYELNANKCISYLTIEHRGEFSKEMPQDFSKNIYGCDICQDVCPWNRKPPRSSNEAFDPREGLFNPALEFLENVIAEGRFSSLIKGSPIKRTKAEGLKRNIDLIKDNDS